MTAIVRSEPRGFWWLGESEKAGLFGFGVSHPSAKDRGRMGHLRFVVRSRAAQRAECVFHWESDSNSIRLRHWQVHCCLTRSLAYANPNSGYDDAGAGSAA